MKHQAMTKTRVGMLSSGRPSQSWLSQSRPKARPMPKFGSSSALNAMPTAAAEKSSGGEQHAEQCSVALLAGHEDAEQKAYRGLDHPRRHGEHEREFHRVMDIRRHEDAGPVRRADPGGGAQPVPLHEGEEDHAKERMMAKTPKKARAGMVKIGEGPVRGE